MMIWVRTWEWRFRLVTDPEGLTVQVTPMGPAALWVVKRGLDTIEARGNGQVDAAGVPAGSCTRSPRSLS